MDAAGNFLGLDATDNWLTDTTAPTADILDITPDPRNSAVGSVSITFSEPVSGVSLNDFTLTHNGSSVSLAGLTLSGTGANYTLDLTSVTAVEGAYVLTLMAAGSGIMDAAGNLLSVNATDSWMTDTTAPTADILDVAPDPRNSAVGSVSITFSEPVSGVGLTDFTLTHNGTCVSLPASTVSGTGASYTLDLTSVTVGEGPYVLRLMAAGSGIIDAAGNLFSVSATDSWMTDTTAPTADIIDVTPDPRNSAVGSVSITFSEPVSGVSLTDFTLTRDGSSVSSAGRASAAAGPATRST